MKKTLIVAGLISLAGLAAAAPAAAAPDSTVSCSPVILCTVNVEEFRTSVTEFFTEGPKEFQDSIVTGPQTFSDSVNDFVKNGPNTFRDSITNPTGATE